LKLGAFDQKERSPQIAEAIKADEVSLRLQNQYIEDSKRPLDTEQKW
jgi:hypothetical protein